MLFRSLTLVAFGTSAPELVVSVDAALKGCGGLSMGNVVGSNICNVALILGAAALITPVKVNRRLYRLDFPLLIVASLAVAACFAEGETILRIPKEIRSQMRVANDFLAENLRKTGVEVGVYDDGLVIRGMETIVNGSDFDGGNSPEAGLALSVLSIALENDEPVKNADAVEAMFPGVVEKLKQVLVAEAPANEGKE